MREHGNYILYSPRKENLQADVLAYVSFDYVMVRGSVFLRL